MKKEKITLPKGILVPNHLAIICDGNRRWARARNLPVFQGHQVGFDITSEIAKACRDFGIHTLTFWAFSTENWDRSKEEIAFLMKKYEDFIDKHLKEAKKDGVKIIHLGRKDRLPKTLVKKIIRAEEETKNNQKYVLNIALDYGGKDEILRATKKILKEDLDPEKVEEKIYRSYLDTGNQPYPYPDMLIRPSGEQRTSSMFAWQGAYTELYWLPDHFPAMTSKMLKEAIIDFSRRRRRFGGNDYVPKVKFEPRKVAELEKGWWQAHNDWKLNRTEENKKRMISLLVEWFMGLYRLEKKDAQVIVGILFKAIENHQKKDWEKAAKILREAYLMIKEKTGYFFTPSSAAELEVNWWKIHDELEGDLDKARLEKAFRDFFGEIYRLSDLQAARVAHFKALATQAHDLAENSKLEKESKKYWDLTKEYLLKTYQALREVAS